MALEVILWSFFEGFDWPIQSVCLLYVALKALCPASLGLRDRGIGGPKVIAEAGDAAMISIVSSSSLFLCWNMKS